jgi:uncharacterized protein (DUF305 family)
MIHKTRDRFVTTSVRTAGLALVVVLGAGACSADASSDASSGASSGASPSAPPSASASDGVTVISPGRPGEAASTGPVDPVQPAGWNDADTAFVTMMVPHHAQALEMSTLAEEHAVDPQVRRLAARIKAAQAPEIATMSAWLAEQGEEPADMGDMGDMGGTDGGMDGSAMHGMLSDDEMAALAAARGADFDRLFLEGMVRHHQGAIDMASSVAVEGSDVRVAELAADVTLTQGAEIGRMQQVLSLPTP